MQLSYCRKNSVVLQWISTDDIVDDISKPQCSGSFGASSDFILRVFWYKNKFLHFTERFFFLRGVPLLDALASSLLGGLWSAAWRSLARNGSEGSNISLTKGAWTHRNQCINAPAFPCPPPALGESLRKLLPRRSRVLCRLRLVFKNHGTKFLLLQACL